MEDARAGGTSGCVEVGAFGKESYILTGRTFRTVRRSCPGNDGVDPATGKVLGPRTGAPSSFATIRSLAHLVRSYFKMDGHHVQFNVVRAATLREAQKRPEAYRDLIVRVAGYSDYFCDLPSDLQEEIISRTEHEAL